MKLILRLIGLKMSILRVDAAIINPKTVKPNLYPSRIILLVFGLTIFYQSGNMRMSFLNRLFNSRIELGNIFWNYYDITLFGSQSRIYTYHPPHLVKSIHIKGHRIKLTFVISNRRICKTIEFCKLRDIIPNLLIVSMKNMGTIFVDIYTLNIFCVNIPSYVRAFVNDQYLLAMF